MQVNKTTAATTGTVGAFTLPGSFFPRFPLTISAPTGFIIARCPHAALELEIERERSTEMAESTLCVGVAVGSGLVW